METDPFSRWPHLDEIFSGVLDRPPDERVAYLNDVCGDDVDLRREIKLLLDAEQSSSGFLEDPGEWLGEPLPEEPVPAAVARGQVIGAYRIAEELGHGGMGAVYLAERADGHFEQRVALKLLRNRVATRREIRRFQSERQILADLQHPNIARLLDGGVAEDGRPYFVMEYIPGVPIDRYCDDHRLTIGQRLDLMQTVCAAVHHAHQNLVVHRDLKPGNVLVTDAGIPKLLDFGIATILSDEGGAGPAAETGTGARLMTPDYASPEQITGATITTASDIYQLGVLLYELLTGRRPFRSTTGRLLDLGRVICTEDPERPSTVVTHTEEHGRSTRDRPLATPEQLSHARATTVERLRRRLEGDLDNICLKAVRKEPERRYRSAQELAEDLARHASGHPVIARPDTPAYRTSKFVRRHRFGVGVALVTGLTLIGFAVAMARQSARTAQERDKAQAVTAFLADLFEEADPDDGDNVLTVRRFLDEGAVRVREELTAEPEVQTALMNVIGSAYTGLGHYPQARSVLEEALETGLRTLGPDHLDVAYAKDRLGLLHVYEMSDYTAAEQLFGDALATRRSLLGEADPLTIESMNNLALALQSQGRVDEAEPLYRRILDLSAELDDERVSQNTPVTMTNLAWLLQTKGSLLASDSLFTQALDLRRRLYSGDHARLANSLSALARSRIMIGELESAEALAIEALAMRRRVYAGPHARTAESLKILGDATLTRGDYASAEASYQEALSMYREVLGPGNQSVGWVQMALAEVFNALDDYERAEAAGRESYEIYRETLGSEHPFVARVFAEWARAVHGLGDHERADSMYREALASLTAAYGEAHYNVASVQVFLAELLMDRGEPAAAEPLLRQAFATRTEVLPEGHRATTRTQVLLGRSLLGQGRYEAAEELLEESYREIVTRFGEGDQQAAMIAEWLAELRGRRSAGSSR
jgi:serine/threonine-protein kinase